MSAPALSSGSRHLRPGSAAAGSAAPIWVGQIDGRGPIPAVSVDERFSAARLLVTVDGVPVGQVDVPLSGGEAAAEVVQAAIHDQLGRPLDGCPSPLPRVTRPITVVIATRGRPQSLDRCVRGVLRSEHSELRVLVVENDPQDDRTAAAVRRLADPRVAYVCERHRGASGARNRGLTEAMAHGAEFVAFLDDDVEVDPTWAGRMVAALSEPGVAGVCGPVLAARLDTPAQLTAEQALGWQKGFARRRFSLAEPPPDSAVFPFSPGLFGVGANLAVNAAVAGGLGGFDAALGPGTSARGGEDCEFMIRLVLAGYVLSYEPSAYVWHHHRPSYEELDEQLHGYAVGLGGLLTKIMVDPVGRSAALRRVPAALRRLRQIQSREAAADVPGASRLGRLRALASGPPAYLRARRAVRRKGGLTPPLLSPGGRSVRP
ncbi:glycosyltransferase family 2 protein [Pseudonocardia hispaniensis]|uniref:Glycosyltransferase family 2 protein n=1 Tax=Pseudonocardia hispaniensis TaxID=904933 RepID=A0ABW1IZC8_9PSEU